MPNRAPCRREHDAKILTDYAIEAAFGYPVFVTQHTASSNCFCCKRCSFGDILCLDLIMQMLIIVTNRFVMKSK